MGHACRQRNAAASSLVLESQLLGLVVKLIKLWRSVNRTQAIVVAHLPGSPAGQEEGKEQTRKQCAHRAQHYLLSN